MVDELVILAEVVQWAVVLFVFTRVIGTQCFSGGDWLLTLVAIIFSYFVRYISEKMRES